MIFQNNPWHTHTHTHIYIYMYEYIFKYICLYIYIYIHVNMRLDVQKWLIFWEEMESLKTKIKSCIDLVLKKVSFDLIEKEE